MGVVLGIKKYFRSHKYFKKGCQIYICGISNAWEGKLRKKRKYEEEYQIYKLKIPNM